MTMVVEGSRRSKHTSSLLGSASPLPSLDDPSAADVDDFITQSLTKMGLQDFPLHDPNLRPNMNGNVSNETVNGNPSVLCTPVTEKECLSFITLALLLRSGIVTKHQVLCFLIHAIMIANVPISSRRLDWKARPEGNRSSFVYDVAKCSYVILRSRQWEITANAMACDIADFIDGRVLHMVMAQPDRALEWVSSTPDLGNKLVDHCKLLEIISGINVDKERHSPCLIKAEGSLDTYDKHSKRTGLLPFSNAVFDKHLAPIRIAVDKDRGPKRESARIFQELTHWHNSKRKLDPKLAKTHSEKEKLRGLRRNQFFMAEMLSYAASLTNAAGKVLEPETITISDTKKLVQKSQDVEKDKENQTKNGKSHTPKGASNKKNAAKNERLESMESRKAAKEEDSIVKTLKAWETARQYFDSDKLPRSRYMKAKAYLSSLPQPKQKYVKAEVSFYLICVLMDLYRNVSTESVCPNQCWVL